VTLALAIAALVAVAAVLAVALPFLREPAPASDRLDERGELESRTLALAEERDRVLAALKELEFDHRTGKVSDEDYRALVGPLRAQAAELLRALEPQAAERGRLPRPLPGHDGVMVEAPPPPAPPGEPGPPEPAPQPPPEPMPTPGEPPTPAPSPQPGPGPHARRI
jgi:hypothetical protein